MFGKAAASMLKQIHGRGPELVYPRAAACCSSNRFRFKSTWAHIKWYRFENGEKKIPLITKDSSIVQDFQKEIANHLIKNDVSFDRIQVRERVDEFPLSPSCPLPAAAEETPLIVTVELTAEEERLRANRETLRELASEFASALKASELQEVQDSKSGLRVLKDIPWITGGGNFTIVVRKDTEPFWNRCDERVGTHFPVCAIGSRGIGKSTTFAVLMRKLLLEGKTFTYIVRSKDNGSYYYQFVTNKDDGQVAVSLYPEATSFRTIPTLDDPEAYLLVDPGETKFSVNCAASIKAKLIINSCPDSRHWGGHSFQKRNRDLANYRGGTFLYYRQYDFKECLEARPYMDVSISEEEVQDRFYRFGGSVRHVFAEENVLEGIIEEQKATLNKLTVEMAGRIFLQTEEVDTGSPSAPSGLIVGIQPSESFTSCVPVFQSRSMSVAMAHKTAKESWLAIKLASPTAARSSFEVYVEGLLLRPECSLNVYPLGQPGNNTTETFGGCSMVTTVPDIALHIRKYARSTPRLLNSSNERHPLFDCMYYRSKDGNFIAINSAYGSSHPCTLKLLAEAVEKLQLKGKEELHLYYAVTSENFGNFKTTPVDPFGPPSVKKELIDKYTDMIDDRVKIFILEIPDPTKSK